MSMWIEKYRKCKKDYSWYPTTYICENSKYLKSIAYDSKTVCEETMNATNSVSTNFYSKKARDNIAILSAWCF